MAVGVALPDADELYRAAAISFKHVAGFNVPSSVGSESCATCHRPISVPCVSMTGLPSFEGFGNSTFQGLPFAEPDIDGNTMAVGLYNQILTKNDMPETSGHQTGWLKRAKSKDALLHYLKF